MELLLNMHLQYTTNYAAGKQDPSFFEAKQQEQKTKFENNQKNREALLKQKRLAKEEDHKEAVKARKILADSLLKLTDCLQKISERGSSDNMLQAVDEKLDEFNSAIEDKLEKKLDEKLGACLAQMQQMFNGNK